jgi:hypothetical protein
MLTSSTVTVMGINPELVERNKVIYPTPVDFIFFRIDVNSGSMHEIDVICAFQSLRIKLNRTCLV